MGALPDNVSQIAAAPPRPRFELIPLLGLHIVACCVSLVLVAEFYERLHIVPFDEARLYASLLNAALFAIVSIVFVFSQFSFGYFLGFYFYTMILGYLWLVESSTFHYDHTLAAASVFVSALAFLIPALFITSPIRQMVVLSKRALEFALAAILILAAIVVAAGAFYNFKLVGLDDIYNFRGEISFPAWLGYAIGTMTNTLLPFTFACFLIRGNRWRAMAALLLILMFYPITLTKVTLFTPIWLLFLALLGRFLDARTAVVLSLFLPITGGIVLGALVKAGAIPFEPMRQYFGAINFRMIAYPSVALDVYSDFFSTHDYTYFCQIWFLKPFMACPYHEYLSIVMERAYRLGNLNASLFATEGIASVGPVLAPLAVLACGLVISIANRLSSGLPSEFVLVSGGTLPQVFLNVPLTTTLLTNGAALLFLLWYITPRDMFGKKAGKESAASC
jgi:hypothetical protein